MVQTSDWIIRTKIVFWPNGSLSGTKTGRACDFQLERNWNTGKLANRTVQYQTGSGLERRDTHRTGLDWTGLDWTGPDRIELDRTGSNWIGLEQTDITIRYHSSVLEPFWISWVN
jgi:hypothetical protein